MHDRESDFKVDQDELAAFFDKVYAEANKMFPGEDGEPLVALEMQDKTKCELDSGVPVPHMHLLETDAEWIDAIQSLSVNASSAAERLAKYVKVYKHNKDVEEGKRQLGRELCDLFLKLGVKGEVSFSQFSPAPPDKTHFWVVNSSEYIEFPDFTDAARIEAASFVGHSIRRMRRQKNVTAFLVHLSPNSDILRVYSLTTRKGKNKS